MEKKCVIVIDEQLPSGEAANISAILGISLGSENSDIIGKNVLDKNNKIHSGIIKIPVPVLKGNEELFKRIMNTIDEDITIIDFTKTAQRCRTYDEYINNMSLTDNDDLKYLGIGLYGNKKAINKLTGNLPLYR